MTQQAANPLKWIFIMVLLMGGLLLWRNRSGGNDNIPWRTDFTAAASEAKQQGKPMVVYFTADWCGPCRQMKSKTWSDAAVASALESYVPVKIDVDKNSEVALKYRVTSIPRVQIINADGQPGASRIGYVSAAELSDFLGK
jgi:protein disulfide-isomerase